MTVRCESAKEEVSVQVSLVVSSSKSRVAATWLGGVDCDVASRQSSSSRIRLGWRHSLDLAGGAAVSTSTRCDRPLHSVLGTGWEASCVKTASILVDAEGRTALVPDLFAGREKFWAPNRFDAYRTVPVMPCSRVMTVAAALSRHACSNAAPYDRGRSARSPRALLGPQAGAAKASRR